ncbi:MAG: SLC13 family permease, partial [Myxococcota bacterium]
VIAGALYSIFVLPRLLPDRGDLAEHFVSRSRRFLGEIDVIQGCKLVGKRARDGAVDTLPDARLLLVQRGEDTLVPDREPVEIMPGDVLIVRATRDAMAAALSRNLGHLLAREEQEETSPRPNDDHAVAEVMIPPDSSLVDRTIESVGMHRRYGCLVIGIQHHGMMETRRLASKRLEAGDELLIAGPREAVEALRDNPELVLMGRGVAEVPKTRRAPHAVAIFAMTVVLAATGVFPIVVAASLGTAAMLVAGCLDLPRAWRALDRKILLLVASTLALSTALQATGAAVLVARTLLSPISDAGQTLSLAFLFVVVAVTTNLLSNNATAILFTPIAVTMARDLGISPTAAAIAVLLGANTSFVTPIGYQTNLLVMGPGHYRFADFVRGGVPLLILVTAAYGVSTWWFG